MIPVCHYGPLLVMHPLWDADVPPPSPAADRTASSPPTLSEPDPGRQYPVRVRKPPQQGWIYEL